MPRGKKGIVSGGIVLLQSAGFLNGHGSHGGGRGLWNCYGMELWRYWLLRDAS